MKVPSRFMLAIDSMNSNISANILRWIFLSGQEYYFIFPVSFPESSSSTRVKANCNWFKEHSQEYPTYLGQTPAENEPHWGSFQICFQLQYRATHRKQCKQMEIEMKFDSYFLPILYRGVAMEDLDFTRFSKVSKVIPTWHRRSDFLAEMLQKVRKCNL